MPPAIANFIAMAKTTFPRKIYTDGSFTVDVPLLGMLTLFPAALTSANVVATRGIYPRSSRAGSADPNFKQTRGGRVLLRAPR